MWFRCRPVVETPSYLVDAERLFSLEERMAIVDRLAADPNAAWSSAAAAAFARCGSASARGAKAARIIYLFSGESLPAFVLAVFAKSEKVNLSAAERNALAKFVTEMVETYRRSKMTRTAFDKITAGLDDAKAFLDGSGNKRGYGIHVPARVNVKKIRMRLGLSQESFAQTYGFALSAVRDWEQGRRQPERSARILLKVVEKEPEAVTRALAKSA
jgi:putative transcriptional regulator